MYTSHRNNESSTSMTSMNVSVNKQQSSNSFATSEMQSVANKIEERYQERAREQQSYEQVLQALEEREQALLSVREAHQGARVTYLEEVRKTQEVELEFHRLQQETQNLHRQTEKSIEEQRQVEEQYHRLEESWSKEQDSMAAAVTKREWYLRCLHGAIQDAQELQLKRKRKILFLKERTAAVLVERNNVEQALERMHVEIQTLEREDGARNVHIQDISEQVRAQLAKRTELRDVLREAKQGYRDANDKAFLHERELMSFNAA